MRRQRCSKHNTLSDGRCPECHITFLEGEIEKYKATLALWGDPVVVHVAYTWRDVFEKVLRAFSFPGTVWGSPTVSLGKNARRDDTGHPMPRAVAEKLAEAAKAMDAEYREAMKKGYKDGVQLLARIASETFTNEFITKLAEALQTATSELDKEHEYSLSRALEDAVKKKMATEDRGDDELWPDTE